MPKYFELESSEPHIYLTQEEVMSELRAQNASLWESNDTKNALRGFCVRGTCVVCALFSTYFGFCGNKSLNLLQLISNYVLLFFFFYITSTVAYSLILGIIELFQPKLTIKTYRISSVVIALLGIVVIVAMFFSVRHADAMEAEADAEDNYASASVSSVVSSAGTQRYVVNDGTTIYHREGCSLLKAAAGTELFLYDTAQQAQDFGYTPCRRCCRDEAD